ncbi:MAG: hypothetical protein EOO04_24475 [Chitinophagaceae bacterium]|nr:MAG: hypothetical protein EOO04_24475 [Chitinophagaceae bacterium]
MPGKKNFISKFIAGLKKIKDSFTGSDSPGTNSSASEESEFPTYTITNKPDDLSSFSKFMIQDKVTGWNYYHTTRKREGGYRPETNPDLVVPVSPAVKRFLITLAILAVICVAAVFYMTISNVRNHRYPVKSIQRGIRF